MNRWRIVFGVLVKTAFVIGMAFELLGCAAPAAVTVASVAADGASYAASGKSLGDHALSTASGQDCSTLGLLADGVLCRDRPTQPAVHVENAVPPFTVQPTETRTPPVDNSEATFLALGIFPDWENADHTVVMGGFYSPLVVPLDVDAKGKENPSFWVVAGHPLAGGDGNAPVAQAKSIGFDGARTVVLCRATYRPAPCVSAEDNAAASEASTAIDLKVKAASRPGVTVAQRVDR